MDPVPLILEGRKAEEGEQERAPRLCPECGAVARIGARECPECGYAWPAPKPRPLRHDRGGKLREVKRRKRRASLAERELAYLRLCRECRDRGYRAGWIAHKYRDRFGVWPRGMSHIRDAVLGVFVGSPAGS